MGTTPKQAKVEVVTQWMPNQGMVAINSLDSGSWALLGADVIYVIGYEENPEGTGYVSFGEDGMKTGSCGTMTAVVPCDPPVSVTLAWKERR